MKSGYALRILVCSIGMIFSMLGGCLSDALAQRLVAPAPSAETGTRREMPASYEETYLAFEEEFSSGYSLNRSEGSLVATPFNEYSAKVVLRFMKTASPDRTDVLMTAIQYNTPDVLRKWELSVLKKVEARLIAAKEALVTKEAPAQPPAKPAVKSDVDKLPSPKTRPNSNAYAIVIGIEQYRQKLPKADFAAHDASIVAEYLTKVLGYPEKNVVTLYNDRAALGDFVKYFEKWLPNNVEKGATVFVYYSGHGAPNPKTADAYLVPYDGDPTFIDETGYPLKRMYAALGKLPAKEIVVALDSCFSGAGGRSVLAKGARPLVMNLPDSTVPSGSMTVMSASSGDEISSTFDEEGHGLFTYFLLKGIKNENVVRQDGSLAVANLFSYLQPEVSRIARKQYNNEQTPQLIGAGASRRESRPEQRREKGLPSAH